MLGFNKVKYTNTKLSGSEFKEFVPKYDEMFTPVEHQHPFYNYHAKEFDCKRYLYPTPPINLGVRDYKVPEEKVKVLSTPVKVAGSRVFHIPAEIEFMREFIKFCALYENSFNPRFEDLFAHITVDTDVVQSGKTQRTPGWHVDGYQGSKFPLKHEIEHSYLWSSTNSTEFCPQPFYLNHLDESKHMIFDELESQAREENMIKPQDKSVILFDPYMIHRSPMCNTNGRRTVVRLTFEYQKLLDPNNTINPNIKFNTNFKYDIRNMLCAYSGEIPWGMYGLVKSKL